MDSLTDDSTFSEIIEPILVVLAEDEGDNYRTYEVYQLSNGKFAVLDSNYETGDYSVLDFDDSLASGCETIGEQGLAVFGDNGSVNFDPGGEVDPDSTTERDQTFWAELFGVATAHHSAQQ